MRPTGKPISAAAITVALIFCLHGALALAFGPPETVPEGYGSPTPWPFDPGIYLWSRPPSRPVSGFGGYIGELRRKGLDVVLVIDGTGSMNQTISDLKDQSQRLLDAVHRLVPIARIGVVVFGEKTDPLQTQPLTLTAQKLVAFLNNLKPSASHDWSENFLGATQSAIGKMDWKPFAKKVIVLIGDSPPDKSDFKPLLELARRFKDESGTFNTIDVLPQEHERFEREMEKRFGKKWRIRPVPPLPDSYRQTRAAYKLMAMAGGGTMKALTLNDGIGQVILVLAFGEQWEKQVAQFGEEISPKARPKRTLPPNNEIAPGGESK